MQKHFGVNIPSSRNIHITWSFNMTGITIRRPTWYTVHEITFICFHSSFSHFWIQRYTGVYES